MSSVSSAMKRKSSLISDTPSKRAPRQIPVSCESCRKKKLKCDRTHPCSSCSARKITCSYGDYGPFGGGTATENAIQTTQRSPSAADSASPRRQQRIMTYQTPEGYHRIGDDPLATAVRLENIMMSHRVPSTVSAAVRSQLSQSHVSTPISRRGSTPGSLSTLIHGCSASSQNPTNIPLISYLPSRSEMLDVFDYYCTHLDYQYHLVIPSRTRQDIYKVYANIMDGEFCDLGILALLFGITSATLFFRLLSTTTTEVAEAASREAAFLAGAALMQGNYMTCPTVAGLQATLIVGHHIPGLTLDASVCAYFVPGTMISQGKSLKLHIIDCPRCEEERRINGCDETELELKRRLWWDLASYDWLLAFLSGPQEFTYSIRPQQMNIRLPLNVEDDEIETGNEKPLSTPTTEICREIVDRTAPEYLQGYEVSYDRVLELDRMLNEKHAELPDFFRFDQSSRRKYADLYRDRPQIAWQSAFIQQGYQARLCRLHRWHFIRGAKDPRYSYSHVVSLQSARKVLELKRIMDEEEPILQINSSFWAVMHHVFMSAVTLLINICFNWDDILAEKQKEEVLGACRMLSRAQQVSSIAREGINAMMGTLRKHWIQQKRPMSHLSGSQPEPTFHVDLQQLTPASSNVELNSNAQFMQPAEYHVSSGQDALNLQNTDSGEVPLEDMFSEMLDDTGNVELDSIGWMELLSELTHSTMPY
ncbi:hypothetical protein N7478_011884 [Penicillium angulare]|uniref:uncharacterized protein n=1 Tax=Penicillium angulare TaxID=116970 RepID=UPI0025424204|nr:uncharacterized protein N7478_011884 [Penicillium angulare]KAJ5261289.1 hypothetical protein N7478_011884 [Penicillium angulare]